MTFEERIRNYEQYLKEIKEDDRDRIFKRAEQFHIDENNLSEHVSHQAAFYNYIANRVAIQQARRNAAKLEEKVRKAERRLALKSDGSLGKLTVDDLSAMVEKDSEVLNACADHIIEQRELDQLEADREACRQKGDMLKLLAIDVNREIRMKSGM